MRRHRPPLTHGNGKQATEAAPHIRLDDREMAERDDDPTRQARRREERRKDHQTIDERAKARRNEASREKRERAATGTA